MAIEEFNSNEVRLIIQVKRGDLQSWISEGYLVPSSAEDAACGKRYMWNRNDIYKLVLFKNLIDFGLNLVTAHEFLKALSNKEIKYLGLVESDHRFTLITNLNLISDKYRFIMWVNFEQIKNEVDNKIEAIFG